MPTPWILRPSSRVRPMLHHGSSAAPASWCTYWIAARAPRAPLRAPGRRRAGRRAGSRRALSRCRPRMVRPSVVLPQPDLPTSPRISPACRSRLTPLDRLHRRHGLRSQPLAAAEQHRDVAQLRIGAALMRTSRTAAATSAPVPRPALRRRRLRCRPARASRSAARSGSPAAAPAATAPSPGMPANESARSGWQASSARV